MKSNGSSGSSSKVDRKTVEKNRRIHMKALCFKLGSLIPKEDKNTKNSNNISQHDHLDQAASYIRKLKARIEKLRQRKRCAAAGCRGGESGKAVENSRGIADEVVLPAVEVRYRDPVLEVVLITGAAPARKFLFYEAIGVLAEEGAEVVNASFSVVNDKMFCTVHSRAVSTSEIALDASKISERLKGLCMQ